MLAGSHEFNYSREQLEFNSGPCQILAMNNYELPSQDLNTGEVCTINVEFDLLDGELQTLEGEKIGAPDKYRIYSVWLCKNSIMGDIIHRV
jgi:hypothetical protein